MFWRGLVDCKMSASVWRLEETASLSSDTQDSYIYTQNTKKVILNCRKTNFRANKCYSNTSYNLILALIALLVWLTAIFANGSRAFRVNYLPFPTYWINDIKHCFILCLIFQNGSPPPIPDLLWINTHRINIHIMRGITVLAYIMPDYRTEVIIRKTLLLKCHTIVDHT